MFELWSNGQWISDHFSRSEAVVVAANTLPPGQVFEIKEN